MNKLKVRKFVQDYQSDQFDNVLIFILIGYSTFGLDSFDVCIYLNLPPRAAWDISCRADIMDLPDPLSPPVFIVHRSR